MTDFVLAPANGGTTATPSAAAATLTQSMVKARTSDLALAASSSVSLGLAFAYGIGETWRASYWIPFQITAGAVGLGWKLNTLPTGVTGRLTTVGPVASITALSTDQITTLTSVGLSFATANMTSHAVLDLLVTGGSGTGTIDLMYTSGLLAAGTIFAGASVTFLRVS